MASQIGNFLIGQVHCIADLRQVPIGLRSSMLCRRFQLRNCDPQVGNGLIILFNTISKPSSRFKPNRPDAERDAEQHWHHDSK